MGAKVQVAEVKRGWNDWAGVGIKEGKYQTKVAKQAELKKARIEELKKKRMDNKMRGVVLNTEDRDKKFAHKYWLKDLPHEYNSV